MDLAKRDGPPEVERPSACSVVKRLGDGCRNAKAPMPMVGDKRSIGLERCKYGEHQIPLSLLLAATVSLTV